MRWLWPARALLAEELSTAELGALGEALVARRLAASGWKVAARRHVVSGVEVDVVAARGGELVCVEVKTGRCELPRVPGARGDRQDRRPARSLTARRARRLVRAAATLARSEERPTRALLAEVCVDPVARRVRVLWHGELEPPGA